MHYGKKSPLIKDRSWDSQVSGRVLWGPVILGSHQSSTCGYHFFVVVFILHTHYLLCPTLYECHDALGDGHKPLTARNISSLFTVSYLV